MLGFFADVGESVTCFTEHSLPDNRLREQDLGKFLEHCGGAAHSAACGEQRHLEADTQYLSKETDRQIVTSTGSSVMSLKAAFCTHPSGG